MSVTGIRDQAGAAVRRRHWALRRKRGTTLIEAVLYISIATAVMIFSIGLMREEQVRRERTALAAELKLVTTAAQTYVSANYETIRDKLFSDTTAGSDLIKAYGVNTMVTQGYLPATLVQTGTTPKSFVGSLQYGLAVRAVLRSGSGYTSGTVPDTQKRTSELTEPATGTSDPARFKKSLVDNIYTVNPTTGVVENDEIDLEALLITINSDRCVIVPAAQGPRIVAQSETNAAGYVTGLGTGKTVPADCPADVASNVAWTGIGDGATALLATGPYGGWKLLLEPYKDLTLTEAEFPTTGGSTFAGKPAVQAGRFISLLSLQKRPPLSESAKIAQQGDSAFRCKGVPPNSAQELACTQSDLMYAGLNFKSWDSNNDGKNDQFPGLLNVNTLEMAPPSDSDGDGVNDVFPGLLNVNTLDMVPPSANGPPQITDLLSLSCTNTGTVETAPGRFTVACPETKMQGLVVTAAATFNTDVAVAGAVSAGSATVTNRLVVGNTNGLAGSAASASAATGGDTASGEAGESLMMASAEASDAAFNTSGSSGSVTDPSDDEAAAVAEPMASASSGEIILNGENLAAKFVTRLNHTFSGEDSLQVAMPSCPTGYAPEISVLPVAFETEEDLRGIDTEITEISPSRTSWKVKLFVTAEKDGEGKALKTRTNPAGSKVVVLTGCKGT